MLSKHTHFFVVIMILIATRALAQTTSEITVPLAPVNTGHNGTVSHIYQHESSMLFTDGFLATPQGSNFLVAEINDRLPTPVVPYLSGSSTQRTSIDVSKAVGSIEGHTTVTEQGQMTYTIPVHTSPVSGNFAPSIQIKYTSTKRSGLLGLGWDLEGLTTISRSGRTLFVNGVVEGVTFTNGDVFELDGQKIVPMSGSNGASGTLYGTMSEDFNKINSYGQIGPGNSPEWFLIRTKSGIEVELGRTTDSKLKNEDGDVLLWKINKMTDVTTGNYINFIYRNNGVEIAIDHIDYGGNIYAGLMPYNSIDFYYAQKSDPTETFVSGKRITNTLILTSVRSKCEGVVVRRLDFEYKLDLYSKLVTIIESSKTEQKNSTIIDWENSNYTISAPSTKWDNSPVDDLKITTRIFAKGDFDGDGLDDFIVDEPLPGGHVGLTIKIQRQNAVGDFDEYSVPGIVFDRSIGGGPSGYTPNLSVVDFDNDGIDEIYVKVQTGQVSGYNQYAYLAFKFDAGSVVGFTNGITAQSLGGAVGNSIAQDIMIILPTDIDGDGIVEAVFLNQSNPDHTSIDLVLENDPAGIAIYGNMLSGSPFAWGGTKTQSFVIDFNGNGRADFCVKRDGAVYILEYDMSTHSLKIIASAAHGVSDKLYWGDFNGDGNSDLIVYDNSPATYKVYLSTGTELVYSAEFSSTIAMYKPTPSSSSKIGPIWNDGLQIVDFNNDGKSDVIISVLSGTGTAWVFVSDGRTFDDKILLTTSMGYSLETSSFLDINGDGLIEHCKGLMAYNTTLYFGGPDYLGGYLVKSITNGMNVKKEFTYNCTRVANADGAYIHSSAANVKYVPMLLITKATTRYLNTNEGISIMAYEYRSSVVDRDKNGFLGFLLTEKKYYKNAKLRQTDATSYLYNGTYSLLYPAVKTSFLNGTAQYDLYEEYDNTIVSKGTYRYWTRLNSVYHFDGEVGTTIGYSYDPSGNVTLANSTNGYSTTAIATTYSTINGYMSKPTRETITKSNTHANSSVVDETDYFYDGVGKVMVSVKHPSLPKKVFTEYGYSLFGLPEIVWVSSPGMAAIETRSEYDPKGRFVLNEYNQLNQKTQRLYNPECGKVIWQQTPDGLATNYSYNSWGDMVQSIDVYGVGTGIGKYWKNPNSGRKDYYAVTTSCALKPTHTVEYNILDQKELESTQNHLGNTVKVDYEYDNDGYLSFQTKPYLPAETPITVNYTYDNQDRLKTITDNSKNLVTTYNYSTLSTQVVVQGGSGTIENTTTERYKDGTTKSITDLSGITVQYKYKGDGKVSEISSGSGTITMTYDAYGNQTQLSDPNAGVTSYTYNSFGQMVSEADAAGNSFYSVYDELGRLISKQDIATSKYKTYTYKGSGNGLNQLASVVDYDGDSKVYTYDDYHRLASVTENVGMNAFSTSYGYQYDDITRIDYPAGYSVQYTRNYWGAVSSIEEVGSGKTLWQLGEVDALNQPKLELLYEGMRWVRSYNNGLLETSQINDKYHNGIFSWSYGFNQSTDNLEWRVKDNSSMDYEEFQYDNMQRLTESTIKYWDENGLQTRNLVTQFEPNGNIKYKSDVSVDDYQYNGSPNAVTHIPNPYTSIPSFDQQIEYNNNKLVSKITENNKELEFTYGPDGNRTKMMTKDNGIIINSHYYSGNYERDEKPTGARHSYHVYSPYGLLGIKIIENASANFYYTYTDYLGTILGLVNEQGVAVEEFSVDAWGRKRNTENYGYENVNAGILTKRCFTGHEHLEDFGLINMNARLYDPLLGRMLSPDNFIQAPQYSQNLNRYSYAFNNPLKYTDPSGNTIIGGGATNNSLNGGVLQTLFYDGGGSMMSTIEESNLMLDRLMSELIKGGGGGSGLGEGETAIFGDPPEKNYRKFDNATHGSRDVIDPFPNPGQGKGSLYTTKDWIGYLGNFGQPATILVGSGVDYGFGKMSTTMQLWNYGKYLKAVKGIGFTGKLLGGASTYLGAPLNTYLDYKLYKSKDPKEHIGAKRFGFRTVGTAAGIVAGAYLGVVPGIVVGGGFLVGEKMYDGFNYWTKQTGTYLYNYERGIKNGWRPK
ncbi:MAG: FG-GAP-like repeat-containing protein [Bacteroidota bacterium]